MTTCTSFLFFYYILACQFRSLTTFTSHLGRLFLFASEGPSEGAQAVLCS